MNHLEMNFANADLVSGVAAAGGGQKYSVVCTNNSTRDWVFYVYQTMPQQPTEVFSLAWFASPYRISRGSRITFTWGLDYCFVWSDTGSLSPGVSFNAGGMQPCDLMGNNTCTFSLDDNAPQLSEARAGAQPGNLVVHTATNVPNSIFSTGIGMSGYGTFIRQALTNMTQVYAPRPTFWIAAANQMQMGAVLDQAALTQAASFDFPPNIYSRKATLNPDNTWTIA